MTLPTVISTSAYFLARLIFFKCYQKRVNKFEAALAQPQAAQKKCLQKVLVQTASLKMNQAYALRPNMSVSDFQKSVPIRDYSQILPFIQRQMAGEAGVVSAEKIEFYEKTSGSSGNAKYIPYNQFLKQIFSESVNLWLFDLLKKGPSFKTGRTYFSISPSVLQNREWASDGTPIGLEDDSQYLNPVLQKLKDIYLVPTQHLINLSDSEEFFFRLAVTLLNEPQLEFLSIWNPTYFLNLLSFIKTQRQSLAGKISRNKKLVCLLRNSQLEIDWQQVWPQLKLISCWDSATAALPAKQLANLFPHCLLQGKGLLCTEAPITIPWLGAKGFVPLLEDIFFEFRDEQGSLFLLQDLKLGQVYELIFSHAGGLLRYLLGDWVQVSHFYGDTPCLQLVGRVKAVSDLTGEKMSEIFVQKIVQALEHQTFLRASPNFFLMAPQQTFEQGEIKYHYRIYYQSSELGQDLQKWQQDFEQKLLENYHYKNCVFLKQLGSVEFMEIPELQLKWFNFLETQGTKRGQIKPTLLICPLEKALKFAQFLGR